MTVYPIVVLVSLFHAVLSQSSKCHCNALTGLQARDEARSFTTPLYPNNYCTKTECSWRITASTKDSKIWFGFASFSVGEPSANCPGDYVSVKDGGFFNSREIAKYCGQDAPQGIISSGDTLYISFNSDDFNTYPGFKAEYYQIAPNNTNTNGKNTISTSTIVGIAVGVVLFVILSTLIVFCLLRHHKQQKLHRSRRSPGQPMEQTGSRQLRNFPRVQQTNRRDQSAATVNISNEMNTASNIHPPSYEEVFGKDSLSTL